MHAVGSQGDQKKPLGLRLSRLRYLTVSYQNLLTASATKKTYISIPIYKKTFEQKKVSKPLTRAKETPSGEETAVFQFTYLNLVPHGTRACSNS